MADSAATNNPPPDNQFARDFRRDVRETKSNDKQSQKMAQAAQAAGASMQAAGAVTQAGGKLAEKGGGLVGQGVGGVAGGVVGGVGGILGGPAGIAAGARAGFTTGSKVGKQAGQLPGKAAGKAGKGVKKAGDKTRQFGRDLKKEKSGKSKKNDRDGSGDDSGKKEQVELIGKILFFLLLCFALLIDILPLVSFGGSAILDWTLDFAFWFAVSLVLFIVTSDIIGSLVGKRGAINIIQTIIEFIPVIDILPIHTLALIIIYLDLQGKLSRLAQTIGAPKGIVKKLLKK